MSTLHKKSKHHIKSVVLTTFLVFFFISFSKAQINLTDWKINAPSSAKARSNTTFKALPEEAVKASISIADFKRKLQKEPQEIVLPTPEGNYETFLIEPTNVVAKEVAHLYTIKTFRGYKKDDPSVLMACDISDYGFHAAIYAGKHTYFVEPASTNISEVEQHYIYYKHQSKAGKVKCGVTANMHHVQQAVNSVRRNIPDTKRTYRLGIIASGEYGQQFGGTPFSTTNVLNALASGVNIINPIYLRDLGVEFNLVSTAAMIFSDPDTDPFDLDDQVEVIELGHTLIVEALGENSFDVGHVVAWENTGGIASLGVVCNDFKGEGFSGSDASVTTLWVDFVAHEIGHQFGAMHNFSSEECEASVDSFRFEPGEGSSIMAYANVCVDSVQYSAGADPYFHYASIKTIQEYIATTNCAITASAGNSNDPVPAAQNNITIPKQTPFVLIGSATDANDLPSSLTYNWLQFDGNGSATTGSPDCNSTTAPLFRYRAPVDVPLRSFPLYSDVIAGNNNAIEWEKLPCTARSMNFVLVARDNNPSFGRVEADSMVVTVADTGPFEVTFPNGGQSFVGNTFNNITWTVNGTDTHCSTVDILLSIDGGETYTVIANATPNDGTQVVAIPNIASSTARILIRCDVAGGFREASTFYDVSNASFAITEGTSFVDADNDGIEASIDCNDNDATVGAQQPAGTACNDGNLNTSNDVILADGCSCAGTIINTPVDNDNDGFNSDVDCDDNNATINPGATEFPNNGVDENCDGIILVIDNDNDGQNSSVDCDDNNPNIGPIRAVGTACDDGNPNTINDVILTDGCSCAGTFFDPNACINNGGDADNDGICANIDCNDNNPTIGAQQTPGTVCNDGNPSTINDVILADGCSCAGTFTPVDNDNDGFTSDVDCNDNNSTINPGAIEVPNNNVDENCDGIALIIDNDNDGQNSSVDCDDNNPNIGPIRAVGTSCDDGNPATINDVILGDGCSCAGTVFNPEACVNNGGDADNDGICADIDCNDNNPTIGAQQTPGTVCNDGNSNTSNDIILADGCSCAGTIINTSIDSDNDGFNSDVDCNDNNPAINPGATEIPGNGIDENCDGIDGMIGTCRVPENIQSEVLSNRTAFLTWDAVPSATSYSVQIRFKGQTRWIITTEVLWNKASIFGPSNRNYEFRVRTNCGDESSAFSDVFTYSTILDFSNSASSRNAANFVSDITIADDIAKTIQLTPNPVRDALSLQYSATSKATITIYHTSGQLIKQTTITKDNSLHPINVSDLEAGLYLLMIEENGNLPITKRFIKIN